ncbi:hypothetical protein ACTFIT_012127 [Dictyostelium discoideum]
MDISYNKYCSEQLRLISDFDKIQEIFEIVLKNLYHLNSYLNKINNIFTYGIGNEYENQLVPDNSIDFIFSFSTLHWVPILSEYKSFEGSLYIPITDCLSVGGIFSCNILIQEDQGSENEEKKKKKTSNWADSDQDDESYIGSIISVAGIFFKNAIRCDKNRVDSILDDFVQRLHLKYKLNPNDFQFHLCNLYLSFLKEN